MNNVALAVDRYLRYGIRLRLLSRSLSNICCPKCRAIPCSNEWIEACGETRCSHLMLLCSRNADAEHDYIHVRSRRSSRGIYSRRNCTSAQAPGIRVPEGASRGILYCSIPVSSCRRYMYCTHETTLKSCVAGPVARRHAGRPASIVVQASTPYGGSSQQQILRLVISSIASCSLAS
jgi:hypothetical protein